MKAQYYLYRNLHTKTFSLKYKGKVIEHPTEIILENVSFNVSEKGRKRVLLEKRKNVHATVSGFPIKKVNYSKKIEVYYNPYTQYSFVEKLTGNPVYKTDYIMGINNKIYILK